jgi:diaminohydroxyphosphoribosylaminopyrimidine deaminase/5-amino-6-(5-phosphoribosylamino)uracil reductase
MSQILTDEKYMRRCLQLARNGIHSARPNPMVGCVITVPGDQASENGLRIIGEGYHIRCGEGHAEVNAFASVKPEDEHLLPKATVYVSLEPCSHYGKTPPCADLIVRKGVRRVVVGTVDPFAEVQGRGIQKLRSAGIEVTVGVLEKECRELNKRFFTFHQLHRPYIILKWAQTVNGFLDDNFHPLAISTPFTQMLSHRLRADEDAIVVGRITDEREHPALTVRHWSGQDPARFVLSKDYSIEQLISDCCERGIQSLIVEGGAKTHESFIDADLWDEIRVETAPITVKRGTEACPLPPNIEVKSRAVYDQNEIITYKRTE